LDNIKPSVSVIIPTTCESRRQTSLLRAISSAQGQEGVDAKIFAIVNGDRVDLTLFEKLKSIEGLEVHRLSIGSYAQAVVYGRSVVRTDYFSFLDDDDEYLPKALRVRVAPMIDESWIDFVATNGYRNLQGEDQPAFRDTADIEQDPLMSLLQRNWLASCGGLFRTATVTSHYFDRDVAGTEWTYLAFHLLQKLRVKFIDVPTFRVNDTPGSLSKSVTCQLSETQVNTIDKMIGLNPNTSLLPILFKHRSAALHEAADVHRKSGNYYLAWRFHLSSLRHHSGWKYIWFTRRLLLPNISPDT
jgi:glycosyltransferase involved in cell wall biosynthesis